MCSPHVSIEPTIEPSLITELEEKLCCTSFLWSDDMDEVFRYSHLGGTDQRTCSVLPTETLAKH